MDAGEFVPKKELALVITVSNVLDMVLAAKSKQAHEWTLLAFVRVGSKAKPVQTAQFESSKVSWAISTIPSLRHVLKSSPLSHSHTLTYLSALALSGGSRHGKLCAFPFVYRGTAYSDCTRDYSSNGAEWCMIDGLFSLPCISFFITCLSNVSAIARKIFTLFLNPKR
jgi:hypothetical protein